MSIEQIIFYLFAALILVSALLVVSMRDIVRSIFLFFVVLFGLAGLYIFALADFIAVSQVIIYVGGVLVLMLFAFLLSNKELLSNLQPASRFINSGALPGIAISAAFFFILISSILSSNADNLGWVQNNPGNHILPTDNSIHKIGISIMTRYLLPFEVVSIFLLMALIGAAHIARKENRT